MPWDIDYATMACEKLHRASFYLPEDVQIHIDIALNLSEYIIDWTTSQLPKPFFIAKFHELLKLIQTKYRVCHKIIENDTLYGHLDLQRDAKDSSIDAYISLCPDMYFHEHLLTHIIDAARNITNKYYIITPQIYKMWDNTWDCLTHDRFSHVQHQNWNAGNVYDIDNYMNTNQDDVTCEPIHELKWAGWFDLYSKSYYEELVPIWNDWHGYGPYDFFGMCAVNAIRTKVDFQQYVLKNQVIFEYTTGVFKDTNFSTIYKKYLILKDIPNQRKTFEENWTFYMNRWYSYVKEKNIITS
jgi:hypothetical protein